MNQEPAVVRENFSKNYSSAGQSAKKLWQNDTLQRRAVSGMWSLDSYDPFQIFQVKHRECHILKVFVEKAFNISKGWLGDLVDKPDPYLILSVPGTPNGKKHTKTIDNDVNPVWDQEFEFYLDPDDVYQLEIVVMDANYTKDGEMDRVIVPLDDLEGSAGKDSKNVVATLPKGAKIYLKLELTKNNKPDLRYSLALSDQEKNFLRMRREGVMDSINKLMPEDGPGHTNEVPMIGLLGSGGGFRALIALSGACTALHDEGIFDCLAYVAGLSGSSWYLSYLYAQPEFPEKPLSYFQPKLREAISKNWKTFLVTKFLHYSRQLINKKTNGQPVSFTDLFGHLVGETLLGAELKHSTLSDQRRCLDKGQMPMPLYTCVNVKKNVSARVFQDWLEFTPFEVGVAKYGAFMKPESFGSKYFVGKIVKQFPEYPLHFLQGVWGSAFCKLIKWHIRGEKDINLADFTSTSDAKLESFKDGVDELIKSQNSRSSAQLEKEIECNSDDDEYQDALSEEATDSTNNPILKELDSDSSDELESDYEEDEQMQATPKLERRGAMKQRPSTGKAVSMAPNSWQERKRTIRQKRREEQESFWNRGLQAIFCSEMLDTREGRAGMIFNPLRGLNLENTFDISPFNPTTPEDDTDFMGLYEPTNLNAKKLYLVDSGLTFNIPFPLLLRPQRAVDLYLSFDFSTRAEDDEPPFKQLIVAEKWASLNHVPFPPVEKQAAKYKEEELKEWYVFDNPEDLQCPTILHFVIYNKTFREFKEPGVRRKTQEERDFANFNVFEEETPYSILNFCYTHEQFDRLSKLMEFNTKLGMPEIKAQIKKAVERRRKLAQDPRPPIALSRLPSIRLKAKEKEYERYMSMRMSMESDQEIFDEANEG